MKIWRRGSGSKSKVVRHFLLSLSVGKKKIIQSASRVPNVWSFKKVHKNSDFFLMLVGSNLLLQETQIEAAFFVRAFLRALSI